MKFAIPTADHKLCQHFGHCDLFTIIEVDDTTKKSKSNQEMVPPPHEPGVLPAWLHKQGVTVVIAGGMGQHAQQLFNQNQIEVVIGAPVDTPENLVSAYLNKTLQGGKNMCDH